jgi:hypothetical protein
VDLLKSTTTFGAVEILKKSFMSSPVSPIAKLNSTFDFASPTALLFADEEKPKRKRRVASRTGS